MLSTPKLSDEEKRAKRSAQIAQWKKDNPRKRRSHILKSKYGITIDQYEAMFAEQGEACAICRTAASDTRWVLDHCHSTKKVRGILCDDCNVMLGRARDNVATLSNAIKYLN